jgi:hypothetical protein
MATSSPRLVVAGQVSKVFVQDNQTVHAGDPICRPGAGPNVDLEAHGGW